MPVPNNYDNIASAYDLLSALIFGRSLRRAQASLLAVLQPGQHVLIVGGGTGWILEAMAARVPEGLRITYVELSTKMTGIARRKSAGRNEIVFINDSITTQVLPDRHFDIVFTAFLFDNFQPGDAGVLFDQLHRCLKTGGHWLFADFELVRGQRFWQKPLLELMYFFFRTLCAVEARQLNDMAALFRDYGYQTIQQQRFYGHFVNAMVCRKFKV